MVTLVLGTMLPWLLIAVGTWLGYQLVPQNGRILLRLESIERQLGARAPAQRHARSIFFAALERAPDQWRTFLDEACGDGAEPRRVPRKRSRSRPATGWASTV
jgi:hypothetical protein